MTVPTHTQPDHPDNHDESDGNVDISDEDEPMTYNAVAAASAKKEHKFSAQTEEELDPNEKCICWLCFSAGISGKLIDHIRFHNFASDPSDVHLISRIGLSNWPEHHEIHVFKLLELERRMFAKLKLIFEQHGEDPVQMYVAKF